MASRRFNRVQLSRLTFYCGLFTLPLLMVAIYLTTVLFVSFAPKVFVGLAVILLGCLLGSGAYYHRDHLVVEYGDEGVRIKQGKRKEEAYGWGDFEEASVCADPHGELNTRLYHERDGLYVDVPASRVGLDAFELRNFAQGHLSGEGFLSVKRTKGPSSSALFDGGLILSQHKRLIC